MATPELPILPSKIFPGVLGATQSVLLYNGHTWPVPIEDEILIRLLEGIQASFKRMETTQARMLLELMQQTKSLNTLATDFASETKPHIPFAEEGE